MKPEELMVGDWVLWKNKPVQIAQISGIKYSFGHIDVELAHCGSGFLERHDIKSISPITIVPEILLKNGFQEGGSYYILYDDKEDDDSEPVGGYEIRFYPGNNFCSIQNLETEADISFYCEYIHQLQQAMRLCGIDKEITLN